MANGKFELYQDKAGEYRFRLKASNGETIGSSEGYKAKASATNLSNLSLSCWRRFPSGRIRKPYSISPMVTRSSLSAVIA